MNKIIYFSLTLPFTRPKAKPHQTNSDEVKMVFKDEQVKDGLGPPAPTYWLTLHTPGAMDVVDKTATSGAKEDGE